ncbi:hypothetical protein [Bartonella jaculi]|uniref:Uncharacterized protein n=1 Tax=Bartonella jaculi TaxID=686226 RepID=A0ABP9NAA6_9HYPH
MVDLETLSAAIEEFSIDTIICLSSVADKLIIVSRKQKLKSLKNLFYLGEAFQPESVLKIKDIIPDLAIKPLKAYHPRNGPHRFPMF